MPPPGRPLPGSSNRLLSRALLVLAGCALLLPAPPAAVAGESDISVEVGVARDDNPFQTPDDSYFDQFDEVVIDPERSSSFLLPVTLDGGYLIPNQTHQFTLDYRLRHYEYENDSSNADETFVRIVPGYRFVTRRPGGGRRRLSVAPFVSYNKEIFFDRDTGIGQTSSLQDTSARYTYLATGAYTGFFVPLNRRVDWQAEARYERRNYEDVPSISTLDHNRYQIGTGLNVDVARRLKLYLDYTLRLLDYDERPSRDPDGGITGDRTPVEYVYQLLGATLRYNPVERWTLYFDLDYAGRTDEFAGYNDYDTVGGRVRALWTGESSHVRLAVRYRQRRYPRAFIFDKEVNPGTGEANPSKDYDIFDTDLRYEVAMSVNMSLFADADLRVQDTADPRFTYDRLRLGAGVRWVFESISR